MRTSSLLISVVLAVSMVGMPVRGIHAADQKDAALLAAEGVKAFEEAKYQKAIHALREATEIEPNNAYYSMALGQVYLSAGKPKLAIPFLKRSLVTFPGDYDIRYALAEAYQNTEDDLRALNVLAGTPPAEPMRASWLFLRGFSLFRLGQYREGEVIFRKLVNYQNTRAPAYFFLANCKFGERRLKEALPLYQKAISLGSRPDNKALNAYFYNYGLALYQLQEFDQAAAAFRKSIELYPADPLPRLFLGRCEVESGQMNQAIANYESLIDNFPNFSPAYYQLAQIYMREGNQKRAGQLFQIDSVIKRDEAEKAVKRLESQLKLSR